MKKLHPGSPIYLVMNCVEWVNTFKCITSLDDCDIKVGPNIPLKEVILLPESLYKSKGEFYEPE